MIHAEATIDIARPPAAVSAFVCDLSRAPEWLEGCVSLELAAPGTWQRGAGLNYVHSRSGHEVRMTGEVTEWQPDRALRMEFTDAMFGVTVELELQAMAAGTRVRHAVSIQLKSFVLKLMAPVIRAGSEGQVAANLSRLKQKVEAAA
jgi:carbon monoxide dehydrogenase subunit G